LEAGSSKLVAGSWGGTTKPPEMPGQNALASNLEAGSWGDGAWPSCCFLIHFSIFCHFFSEAGNLEAGSWKLEDGRW